MKQRIALTVLFLAIAVPAVCAAGKAQSRADFLSALQNRSTAPSYVKVRITDARSGQSFVTCITSNLLMGAVHIEHGFPYTERGRESADQLAKASTSHAFTLGKPKALANIPWRPSPKEFSAAANLVASVQPAKLNAALQTGELSAFYAGHPRRRERMAALACALIDRGHKPRMADISGQLYVER
jgi:hypothetical protein